jgi:hypothetical protein
MKNTFWDVAPWRSYVNRRFGGTYRLHLQGTKIRERGTSVGCSLQLPPHAGSSLSDFSTLKIWGDTFRNPLRKEENGWDQLNVLVKDIALLARWSNQGDNDWGTVRKCGGRNICGLSCNRLHMTHSSDVRKVVAEGPRLCVSNNSTILTLALTCLKKNIRIDCMLTFPEVWDVDSSGTEVIVAGKGVQCATTVWYIANVAICKGEGLGVFLEVHKFVCGGSRTQCSLYIGFRGLPRNDWRSCTVISAPRGRSMQTHHLRVYRGMMLRMKWVRLSWMFSSFFCGTGIKIFSKEDIEALQVET